ncbi:uncharacterized protein LOC106087735 [Stomoxys calcitrans]|uniref:uncharacterized protein LOC106087735 n=1 Tax=Stomoxys calcitrans TaxID=35570 RepID=UPI0027E24FC2|nr:uncharacterized protein LOC106087735 [Stomoxys calcitrans]
MKYLFAILFVLVLADCQLLALADTGNIESTSFNGRPGCKTQTEVGQVYANFFDSTRYWRCLAVGVDAIPIRCPNGYGFQPQLGSCVSFASWQWETQKMPPSCPDFEAECIPNLKV